MIIRHNGLVPLLILFSNLPCTRSFNPSEGKQLPSLQKLTSLRDEGSRFWDCGRREIFGSISPLAAAFLLQKTTQPAHAVSGLAGLIGLRQDEPFGKLPAEQFLDKSGIRYYDYVVGQGPLPAYGQVLRIDWVGYVRTSADSELSRFDSSLSRNTAFLFKHGNGRIVQGLDAGIHTMRVGGIRRIIIPPALGYTDKGIYGPIPPNPFDRKALENLIDRLSSNTGEVVFDVKLLEAYDDDADPGYYTDETFSAEIMRSIDQRIENMKALAK